MGEKNKRTGKLWGESIDGLIESEKHEKMRKTIACLMLFFTLNHQQIKKE